MIVKYSEEIIKIYQEFYLYTYTDIRNTLLIPILGKNGVTVP